jgi:hypothetical protein
MYPICTDLTLTNLFMFIFLLFFSTCVKLNRSELLFDKMWTTFQADPFSCAVYLEALEPYILRCFFQKLSQTVLRIRPFFDPTLSHIRLRKTVKF